MIGVNDVSQSSGKSINLKKSEIDYRLMLNRSGVSKPDSEGCFNGSLRFADDSFKLRIQRDHGPAEIEKTGKIVARLIKKCRTIQSKRFLTKLPKKYLHSNGYGMGIHAHRDKN